MFTRVTSSKWRLTKDAQRQIGSLLVYMRNEYRAGEAAVELDSPNSQSPAIEGTSLNYKRLQQAIDRMLSRLGGTWDAHKLQLALNMLDSAFASSETGVLSRSIINQAVADHESMELDCGGYRIEGTRDAAMDDANPQATGDPRNP